MNERHIRSWVRGWWADQMLNPTVPDLPVFPVNEDRLLEIWADESRRIAAHIHPSKPESTQS